MMRKEKGKRRRKRRKTGRMIGEWWICGCSECEQELCNYVQWQKSSVLNEDLAMSPNFIFLSQSVKVLYDTHIYICNADGAVCLLTRLRAALPRNNRSTPGWSKGFFSSTNWSRPALGPTQVPIQGEPTASPSPRIKWSDLKVTSI